MDILPKSLNILIEELGKLPSVGARTAERYAFAVLKRSPGSAEALASAINDLHANIKECPKTFMLISIDQEVSPLYSKPGRDRQLIAVVEDSLDVVALEKTSKFKGTYHVLGGALSPIDGIGPESLHIDELIRRIESDEVKEVIVATNASVEGESTALYLQKVINEKSKVKVTRLARGLPAGVDLEYADQLTLSRALEERQAI